MSPLRVERLDDRYLPAVAALLGRVFGRRPSPLFRRRTYATPFLGRRAVGVCGLVPQPFVDGDAPAPTGAVPFARAALRVPGLSTPFVAAADRLLRPILGDPLAFRNPLIAEGAIAQRDDAELPGFRSFTPNRLLPIGGTTARASLGRDLRIGCLDALGDADVF